MRASVPNLPYNAVARRAIASAAPHTRSTDLRSHTTIIAAFAAITLAAGSASAQGKSHDKDHGKDKGKATKHISREDAEAIRLRERDRVYVQGSGSRVPPGLAKKPGQMPPGQYKKR